MTDLFRGGRLGLFFRVAAAVPVVLAALAPGPAFGTPPGSPPLEMEEVEIHGSGELPERLFVPAPAPDRIAVPVHHELLRERILAPISPWESDDEDRHAGIDRVERDDRD
ncbi:MAG: hypothetical protein ACM3NF_09730 [Gemmatimonadota bacterium]